MIKENNFSLINGNTIELHYGFKDESHTMDAFVQNKCEYELLGILREIAFTFNVKILIETEPLADGGLRRWFKFISLEEKQKTTIAIALITALVTGIFITPLASSLTKATEIMIERIFEDKELKDLEKQKLKLEIEKLKQETERNNKLLNESNTIKKRRSNFYEALENYPKVDRVSLAIENENKSQLVDEKMVYRNNFKDFILVSDYLEPIEIENAVIEIISPVLKKGNYKWLGIYNGESIPFNMQSNEFKTLVQTGNIEFKNGSSINCFLTIRKKMDNEGLEQVIGYDVKRVNNYFENDKPIETPEGKHHRQKKESEKSQFNLFDTESNNQV